MQIKKDTKVKVQYRPEMGTGTILQVAEALDGYTQIDVVFEKDGKRFLETFPQNLLAPVERESTFRSVGFSLTMICPGIQWRLNSVLAGFTDTAKQKPSKSIISLQRKP
jgi:hypothetical protein